MLAWKGRNFSPVEDWALHPGDPYACETRINACGGTPPQRRSSACSRAGRMESLEPLPTAVWYLLWSTRYDRSTISTNAYCPLGLCSILGQSSVLPPTTKSSSLARVQNHSPTRHPSTLPLAAGPGSHLAYHNLWLI